MFEIGNTLREARVRRNLTLQQVEEDIKIRVKYVQAMENEDWDVMPGATYSKGFLRTYAIYLGLDPDIIVDEFRSRGMVPSAENPEPFSGASIIGKPRSHRGRNTIVVAAILCLVVLGALYAVGLWKSDGDDGEPTTNPSALGISKSPSPSKSSKASSSATATTSPKASASPTGTPAWQTNLIKIEATNGSCWMEVRRNNSGGTVLFSGTLDKGEKKKFKGADIWMNLGAPGSVELNVEGKDVKLKSDTGPWKVEIIKGRVVQGSSVEG